MIRYFVYPLFIAPAVAAAGAATGSLSFPESVVLVALAADIFAAIWCMRSRI